MAVDVDWAGTDTNPFRIFVPKADTVLIQASPEVRELDADALRLELKNLEASVDGMPWTDTHDHGPERTLSGLVYGRFVQILEPYTLEFEDGQYAISVTGANTNFIDRKIANQVSLLGNNSAGLINTTDVLVNYQFAVWVDTVNGTPGTIVGTSGLPRNPVDNLDDAVTIADALGIRTIQFVTGTDTLGVAMEDFEVKLGRNATLNFGGMSVDNSEFSGGTLTGTMTGSILTEKTDLINISGFTGKALLCGINGTIALGAGQTDWHLCHSNVAGASTPTVDFVGAGRVLSNRAYTGGLELQNMTDPSNITSLDYLSGQVIFDASCTDGTAVVRDGIYPVTDSSVGTTIIVGTAAARIWGALASENIDPDTMGELLDDAATKAALAAALITT